MFVVPADMAVTNPLFEIVATVALEDCQGFAVDGLPEPESWAVCEIQALKFPDITGKKFTVNVAVILHPLEFV